jgi:8-amino-7-oxononanoate synthase
MQTPADSWNDLQRHLDELAERDLLRKPVTLQSPAGPTVVVDGRELLCLCSNDYLGLANDERVKRAAAEAIATWGVGSGASRLVCGTQQPHVVLEDRLAAFKACEGAVVTSTGWAANHAALAALAGRGDLVLCDKLDHASILDAAAASGATLRTFPHRQYDRLARMLEKHRPSYRRCVLVSDSVFSMDGDTADVAALVDLKKRYQALLILDEAHATGVLGPGGSGLAAQAGLEHEIDATVGTLSKAIGALGGFVTGRRALIDIIRNTSRPYIYTTAPPAAICAAAIAALDIIENEPDRREHLGRLSAQLRRRLAPHLPLDTSQTTPIIPVIVGEPGRAVELSRLLLEAGFLVPAIRPPTVPPGTSRLRISLSAAHSPEQIDAFATELLGLMRARASS